MAIVKSKLEVLDELKGDSKNINARVDKIEAMNERHNDSIYKLEHRANKIEEFTRSQMTEGKRQQTSVMVSVGIAVLSAILSVVTKLF